jgi:hypothetical protein
MLIFDLRMGSFDGCGMIRNLMNSPFINGLEIVTVARREKTEVEAQKGLVTETQIYAKPVAFAHLRQRCENLLERRCQEVPRSRVSKKITAKPQAFRAAD